MPQRKHSPRKPTIPGVCKKLEDTLARLRVQGYIDRLPPEFQSISASSVADIEMWWERLLLKAKSSRLNSYFMLFDTARLRIAKIREASAKTERQDKYEVSVSRLGVAHEVTVRKRVFTGADAAANACLELVGEGYKIIKVKLPSGHYVKGSQIESAIKAGRGKLKVALMR